MFKRVRHGGSAGSRPDPARCRWPAPARHRPPPPSPPYSLSHLYSLRKLPPGKISRGISPRRKFTLLLQLGPVLDSSRLVYHLSFPPVFFLSRAEEFRFPIQPQASIQTHPALIASQANMPDEVGTEVTFKVGRPRCRPREEDPCVLCHRPSSSFSPPHCELTRIDAHDSLLNQCQAFLTVLTPLRTVTHNTSPTSLLLLLTHPALPLNASFAHLGRVVTHLSHLLSLLLLQSGQHPLHSRLALSEARSRSCRLSGLSKVLLRRRRLGAAREPGHAASAWRPPSGHPVLGDNWRAGGRLEL